MFRKVGMCLVLLCLASVSLAEELPQKFSGDGLTIVVKTMDDDTGNVTGDLVKGDKTFPFTGQIQEENTGEAVTGSFVAEGEKFPFTSRVDRETGDIFFSTGAKTYRLRPEARKPKPNNPLEAGDDSKDNPLNDDGPVQPNPLDEEKPAAPNPMDEGAESNRPPARVEQAPANNDEALRLKLVKFNDINMGVPAYTMLIPPDWKATGHIEWGPAENPFPQTRVRVEGPDGSAIAYIPMLHMTHAVFKPVAGMPPLPEIGVPPPQDVGDFIVQHMQQHSKGVSNVRLVESKRNEAAERALEEQARAGGFANRDIKPTIHTVTVAYDKNNRAMREQMVVSYARYADFDDMNSRSQSWSMGFFSIIAAPEDRFEATKATLYRISGTFRAIPNWWVQQFEARQLIQNQRHIDAMAEIKRRGEFYSSMSDMQYEGFKKQMASMDKAQKDRVDTIYERQDYRDVDGKSVNLTFHYKHVYSDGSGNYVLTNNSLYRPKDGNYKEIEPAR